MVLLNRLAVIITIWVFGMNVNLSHVLRTIFANDEVNGVWQLIEVKENRVVIEDEKYTECGLREEMEIWTHGSDTFEYAQYKIRGYEIGRTDYLICISDPETFQTRINRNSCYDSIIQDLKNKEKWYQVGEGLLIEYHASLKKGLLILKEKENKYSPDSKKRILTFKRKKSKT